MGHGATLAGAVRLRRAALRWRSDSLAWRERDTCVKWDCCSFWLCR